MALGFGLIWEKTRKIAGFGLIGLHVLICIFLVKMGWNLVVIPWNIALASMLWLTTKPDNSNTPISPSANFSTPALLLPLVLAWFCPLFYFFNCWPHNLSWQLYSNTQPEATFFAEGNTLPPNSAVYNIWEKHAFEQQTMLLLDDWAIEAFQTPMFASEHTFQQMREYLCSQSGEGKGKRGMFILRVNPWNKSAEQLQKIDCE